MTTAAQLLAALALPAGCAVNRRVPKKMLVENGAPTAADKRRINEGIEELFWVATLKPTTIGVPEYRDAVREYLEIAVLRLSLRARAKAARLVELLHRAVPYPVLLATEQGDWADLSAAHKRWAQNEAGKVVLDGEVVAAGLDVEYDGRFLPDFLAAMALGRQPRGSMHAVYQGWIDTLLALGAARLIGTFRLAPGREHAAARREGLDAHDRLQRDLTVLRAKAQKEKQINRRVELNLEIKRLEAELAAAAKIL